MNTAPPKDLLRIAALAVCAMSLPLPAQNATPQPPAAPQEAIPAPKGQVLFERHATPDAAVTPTPATTEGEVKQADADATPDVSDTERAAVTFTQYDLDAHLAPSTSQLTMRARLTVRNDGSKPLTHIALQISSALAWESVTLDGAAPIRLPLAQHLLQTDADHTGSANEAVLTLPAPLAPGASVVLDTFYGGALRQNSNRLERIGAPHDEAASADWDAITESSTALRGFGNVLWYPVSSPQVFLGQGAQLFDAIGQMKLRESTAHVRLRLSVDAAGQAPVAAYFCGRRLPLVAHVDSPDAPVRNAPALATVEFPEAALGFRAMSLFLINAPETIAATTPGRDDVPLVAVETTNEPALPLLTANAKDAALLLGDWLGPKPLSALTILDHPGQPFEDGPLLVAPLTALGAAEALPALTHSLTHAWVQTGQPWIDEGLAQFVVLLQTERSKGRDAATAQFADLVQPLQLVEPAPEAGKPAPAGQSLPSATNEAYYRRKAAAVWWMLRDIAGEDALKLTLQGFRTRPISTATPEEVAHSFEEALEKTCNKDLSWFFDDWVLHDRGLPDLTLYDVTPRELPSTTGRAAGWLVSVTVRNEGAAVADVPLVIRSGSYSTTQRIRVSGFSSSTTRIVVEAAPTEVILNDGTTPEQRNSLHTRSIVTRGKP